MPSPAVELRRTVIVDQVLSKATVWVQAMSPNITFALLADHPELRSVVAEWLLSEWPSWYGPNGDGNAYEDVLRFSQVNQLPLGLLAFAAGVPAAFGALKEDKVPGFEHAAPWLGAGYVIPSLRGQGVGLRLIRALEEQAARLGYKDVRCATATAQSLMLRAGWSYAGASSLGGKEVAIFHQRAPSPLGRSDPLRDAPVGPHFILGQLPHTAAVRSPRTLGASNSPRLNMQLVWPSAEHLPSYIAALQSGWSADNVRGAVAAAEELERIAMDPAAFLASMVDREAKGEPVKLPDGSVVKRIPGLRRWIWDGEFCGVVGFRWQPGTEALPPHCLGHIGYAVVPAKRNRGYATQALRETLPLARAEGLRYVEVTTDPENIASQRTIEANGGVLLERFVKPAQFGATPGLRYRIQLT